MTSSTVVDALPSTFGSFRLLESLGEGAAGEVYLATPIDAKSYADPGDPLAVKIYKPSILAEPNQAKRIEREFEVGSDINHPNLVNIHEYVPKTDDEPPHLIMEYVDGMPLHKWLEHFHPIAGRLLVRVASQLASAVAALHDHGIVHRDIKPANIMLSSDFSVRLMDFGVVRITGISEDSPLTPTGRFLGTIRNASPEYLFQGQCGDATDIYSLGTVFFALLHGHEVFADQNQWAQLVAARREQEPEWDSTLEAGSIGIFAAGLRTLAERLLERQPGERPRISEIREELNKISERAPEIPDPEPLHGYMACALTGLDGDTREAVIFTSHKIAQVARRYQLYVYEPRKATDPLLAKDVSDTAVYELDRKRVVSADVLFVLANKPSFGVGQEIEIAASYGKPILIVAREGTSISKMVTGSYANLLDDIIYYQGPEDLARKLSNSLARVVRRLRSHPASFLRVERSDLGASISELRQAEDFTLAEFAEELGISRRLLEAIESGKLQNLGLRLLDRIATTLQVPPVDLLGDETTPPAPRIDDASVRNLSRVAADAGWPHADYVQLLNEYQAETAAMEGGGRILREDHWMERHRVLEKLRVEERSQQREQYEIRYDEA